MGYNFVKVVIFWNLKHLFIIHLYSFVSLKEFKLLNDIYGQWIFSYFFFNLCHTILQKCNRSDIILEFFLSI